MPRKEFRRFTKDAPMDSVKDDSEYKNNSRNFQSDRDGPNDRYNNREDFSENVQITGN